MIQVIPSFFYEGMKKDAAVPWYGRLCECGSGASADVGLGDEFRSEDSKSGLGLVHSLVLQKPADGGLYFVASIAIQLVVSEPALLAISMVDAILMGNSHHDGSKQLLREGGCVW